MVISKTTKSGDTYIQHSRPTLADEQASAAAKVIRSGHIAEGQAVHQFEESFAAKMGFEHATAVSSGTAALHLALMAMGIGPDHEVIIPSYVCSALLHAVQYVGAQPVPAEIDPLTCNIDPVDVKKRITARTGAVIVPHMFGLAADLEPLLKLGVPILEDCAQAVGGTYHQKPLGSFGEAAIFSFYATKMMATGEGGMVTSKSPEIIARVRDLKTYDGKSADRIRYNYKMTDIQAAVGQIQLMRLDNFVEQRRKIARFYIKRLKSLNIKLPAGMDEHIYYRFVVRLDDDCDGFIQKLSKRGVECARPVFLPIHRHLKKDGYPVTDKVWETSLSIPIYPSLSSSAIKQIIDCFIGEYEKHYGSVDG